MLAKLFDNLPLKALSLLIAIVLWFAVLGSRNVEVSKEVPIELLTPPDLVVSNEVPDRVAFRMSGPKAFLRNVLNRKEEPIRINFTASKPGLMTYRLFQDNIQVPIGVKVLSVNPAAVVVKLEPVKFKEVPVTLVTKGQPSPGYNLARIELVRSSVRLKGAEAKIDMIDSVSTQAVDLGEVFESGDRDVAVDLANLSGVFVEGEPPRVHYEVVQTVANFKIRNADVKVLTSRKYKVEPKEVTIYVRCSPEELKQVNRQKVYGIVDLRNKTPGNYELQVSVQLPSHIKLLKVVPPKVKVALQ